MLVDDPLSKPPITVFLALDLIREEMLKLLSLEGCQLGHWAKDFLNKFDTLEKLAGAEAQGTLLNIAQGYLAVESVKVEYGHGRMRRLVHSAVQTYKRPTEEAIQDMTLLNQRQEMPEGSTRRSL